MLIRQAETAIESFHAHRNTGRAQAQQARILRFIGQRGGDWSIGELARAMGMEKSTVSARVNEMVKTRDLVEMPKRKDRVSNVRVRPVGLPAQQGELWQ